jgi:hypothetical protein
VEVVWVKVKVDLINCDSCGAGIEGGGWEVKLVEIGALWSSTTYVAQLCAACRKPIKARKANTRGRPARKAAA